MSDYSRVAWTEGMFLRPQHFQQSDKHLVQLISQITHVNHSHPWGIVDFEIDRTLLTTGQLSISQLSALMPDLCPVNMPSDVTLPEPLVVDKDTHDEIVYLAIPALKQNGVNISAVEEDSVTRYKLQDENVSDDLLGSQSQEVIQVAKLNCRLLLAADDTSGFSLLPIARIIEVNSEGNITLDSKFVPPVLTIKHCKPLVAITREISALLNQRADNIAGRLSQGYAGSTSVADFILLQTLNKFDAILASILSSETTHPHVLYTRLIELSGELATFSSPNKRVPKLPSYDHTNLQTTFDGVMSFLSQSLSQVVEQTATEIKLEQSKFGISFGALNDKSLLSQAQFVLAVKANVPHEELRQILPAQIKIGTVENIRGLVNNQLSGITIHHLPSVPREIPYHAGFHYFELNKNSEHWNQLQGSGGIAIHLSGHYPDLQIALWAIRT